MEEEEEDDGELREWKIGGELIRVQRGRYSPSYCPQVCVTIVMCVTLITTGPHHLLALTTTFPTNSVPHHSCVLEYLYQHRLSPLPSASHHCPSTPSLTTTIPHHHRQSSSLSQQRLSPQLYLTTTLSHHHYPSSLLSITTIQIIIAYSHYHYSSPPSTLTVNIPNYNIP